MIYRYLSNSYCIQLSLCVQLLFELDLFFCTNWVTLLTAEKFASDVTFNWDTKIEVSRAFIIRNEHHSEFYLKSVIREDVPGTSSLCNAWIYHAKKYKITVFSLPTR